MAEDDDNGSATRNTYRQGGAPKSGRTADGPGSHGWTDAGPKTGGPVNSPEATETPEGAPGEPGGSDHYTTGTPSPDLGRGWGRAPAPPEATPSSMPAPADGAYEGWSGRTGQDYHPDGRQSFEQPTGPWSRGGAAPGPAGGAWHAERTGTEPPAEGDPAVFRGEAAYNQSVREPYGAYQGGTPGEAPVSEHLSQSYAQWRAEQLKKLDDDYAAWCRQRQTDFDRAFESWRRQRRDRADRSEADGSETVAPTDPKADE